MNHKCLLICYYTMNKGLLIYNCSTVIHTIHEGINSTFFLLLYWTSSMLYEYFFQRHLPKGFKMFLHLLLHWISETIFVSYLLLLIFFFLFEKQVFRKTYFFNFTYQQDLKCFYLCCCIGFQKQFLFLIYFFCDCFFFLKKTGLSENVSTIPFLLFIERY